MPRRAPRRQPSRSPGTWERPGIPSRFLDSTGCADHAYDPPTLRPHSSRPWSAPTGIWTVAMPLATSPSSSTDSIVATTSRGCSRGSPTLPSAHRRCLGTCSSSLRHVGNQELLCVENGIGMSLTDDFARFLEVRRNLASSGQLAEYGWVDRSRRWPITYAAYGEFLREHACELANSINELRHLTRSLNAWSEVLTAKTDVNEKIELLMEFIGPIATTGINLPYVIRSRFIYSVTHLCHQANRNRSTSWIDDLPMDSEIYFAQADSAGAPWASYNRLKRSLEQISARNYSDLTRDFRNSYNHRYSPRIEMGLTGLVRRNVGISGQVTYSFGHTEPLTLAHLIPVLNQQHHIVLNAFSLYRRLVEEQLNAIQA